MILLKIICFTDECFSRDNLFHIKVYDLNNNLIFESDTKKEGYLFFTPPCFGIYKFHITYKNSCTIKRKVAVISLYKNKKFSLYIPFYSSKRQISHPIIINLTDQFYPGLPIKKGEITLCQKNI